MKRRIWRVPVRLVITALVFTTLSKSLGFGVSFVIDVLTEARLLTQVGQAAQIIDNTLQALTLARQMASEVTHPPSWRTIVARIVLNAPHNLYGETTGWGEVWTGGAGVNPTWDNSSIPIEHDVFLPPVVGSTIASTTATAEIADATAQDALASVQQFYQNKAANDQAAQSLQSDFQDPGNDTYLAQMRIANGIGLQSLNSQKDVLTQLANLTRIQSVLVKQLRDQNTDNNNFIADFHRYQATQSVAIDANLASGFQSWTLP